jgi:hypothetical protein
MGQVIPLHAPAPAPTWYATLAAVLAGLPVEPSQLQAAAYAATAAWDLRRPKLERLRDELGHAQTPPSGWPWSWPSGAPAASWHCEPAHRPGRLRPGHLLGHRPGQDARRPPAARAGVRAPVRLHLPVRLRPVLALTDQEK